jgi:hypothetical protein
MKGRSKKKETKIMTKQEDTKVVTGVVRVIYAYVFTPQTPQDGQEPKYRATLLIPKSQKKTLDAMKKAIETAKQAGLAKLGGKIPANLHLPLRDGDTDESKSDQEIYHGHYFINTSAKFKPQIIDRNKQPITDSQEFYSGCYALASVNFYAYSTAGNKGIACGLNNLLKVRDGDYVGGRSTAEDDFANTDLSDLDDDDEFLA